MPAAASPSRTPDAHSPALDWLRVIASLTVLVMHARGGHWLAWPELAPESRHPLAFAFFAWGRLGHEAVILFFVLAGYLIGGTCWQKIRARSFRPAAYASDRATRFYLGYIPALAISLLINHFFLSSEQGAAGLFAGHLFFLQVAFTPCLQSNPALWTIAYMAWFYAFAGAVGACVCARPGRRWLGAAVAVTALLVIASAHLPYFVCWIFGVLARQIPASSRPGLRYLFGGVLVAAGSVGIQLGSDSGALPSFNTGFINLRSLGEIICGMGAAAFLPDLARLRLPPKIARAGAWLAGFSFSLYLVHMPLLAAWNTFTPDRRAVIDLSSITSFLGKILLCYTVAWLFHRLFEAPLPALRAWLRRRSAASVTPS